MTDRPRTPSPEGAGQLDEGIRDKAQQIGAILNGAMDGTGYGFALLVFPLNEKPGNMNFISNADREMMLLALKELVANMEGDVVEPPSVQ